MPTDSNVQLLANVQLMSAPGSRCMQLGTHFALCERLDDRPIPFAAHHRFIAGTLECAREHV
jgi:hypothetical protein